jgi:hypothetical protein
LAKLDYVCDGCGRVAVAKKDLCRPTQIKK